MPAQREPRVEIIEGRRTLVIERTPPLPPRLDTLLAGLTVYPVRVVGWRSECSEQEHRWTLKAEGPYLCRDGIRRTLRVMLCRDCESAQVRDVSIDGLPGLRTGRLAPRRRDHVIGWYTGARARQRVYM